VHRLGLRPRLVGALVLTAVLTLAVTAVALLSPLDRQLRNEELETLAVAAQGVAPALAHLPPRQMRRDSRALKAFLETVRRRARAGAAVIDGSGRVIGRTDEEAGQPPDAALRALRTRRTVREATGEGDDAQAIVAVPVPVPVRAGRGRLALQLQRPLDAAVAASRVVRRALATAALIGLAAALVLGLLLAGGLTRRLRRLRQIAIHLADLGPTAELTADPRPDEVGDVSRALAQMQHQLREQEQARRSFVATASHELRTPLTSLGLMLELVADDLARERPDVDDAQRQVADARDQTARLAALAVELLDLSRLDAGVPLRGELVDVEELCRAVLAEFAPRAAAGGVALGLEAAPRTWAVADPDAVARVVRILVDNALRHAPPRSRVTIELAQDGRVALAVADEGPGVAAEDAERIFRRFERGPDTSRAGFGLGLAIGRELARQMDGDLVLAGSPAGARFVLTLPAAPAP